MGKPRAAVTCPHESFFVHGSVFKLTDTPVGPVQTYRVDVTVTCDDGCGQPFEFVGLPIGLLADQPTTSPARTELRAPIRPARPRRVRRGG